MNPGFDDHGRARLGPRGIRRREGWALRGTRVRHSRYRLALRRNHDDGAAGGIGSRISVGGVTRPLPARQRTNPGRVRHRQRPKGPASGVFDVSGRFTEDESSRPGEGSRASRRVPTSYQPRGAVPDPGSVALSRGLDDEATSRTLRRPVIGKRRVPDASTWRCLLCGHWLSVPLGSQPLAFLRDSPATVRECVVHLDGHQIHRCEI